MVDFVHEIEIAADSATVRDLIAKRGDLWWTTNAVISDVEGGACEFRFPSAGFYAAVRVLKNAPGLIEWRCVGSTQSPSALRASGGTDTHEWVGTTIRFKIEPIASARTRLRLEHLGLGASADFYSTKNNVWAFYLSSLKKLAETGAGEPFQGGRPGSQTEGLVVLTVTFEVQPDKVELATQAIATFIENIERNEPDTLVYRSYRDLEEPNNFVHYMIFRSPDAHNKHRDSSYCAAFVKVLYPCCVDTPRMTPLALFREAAISASSRLA